MTSPVATPRAASTADPNERRGSSLLEKPGDFKGIVLPQDPDTKKTIVIGTGSGQYYAYQVMYADGRTEYEWYKRGSGTPGEQDDPVALRTPGPVAADIKDKWDAARKKEEEQTPTTRSINGVPHQVTGKDANGQDIWSPVQTATGPAAATGSTSQAAAPGGAAFIDDDEKKREHGRRWGWNPQTRLYDRDLGPSPTAQEIQRNASLPAGQDPRAETDEERRQRAKDTITQQGQAAANAARPGTEIKSRTDIVNGREVTVTTWRLPDGRYEDRIDDKPVPPKVGTIVKGGGPLGEDIQAIADPVTGVVSYQPIKGAQPSPDNMAVPADAPKFVPDYNQNDLGLTAYNEALTVWARAGGPERRQIGRRLIEQAGALATQTASHGTTLRGQAATARGQDITQRGQDVSEVASRRGDANGMFQNLLGVYDKGAANLMGGEGGLASRAFLAALDLGGANARAWGGMQEVPRVPAAYQQAIGGGAAPMPGTQSTQIVLHPGGNVEVSPVGSPAPVVPGPALGAVSNGVTATNAAAINPTGANVQAANAATIQGANAAFEGLIPRVSMAPGDPYMSAIGASRPPSFTPDRNALRQQFPDLSDEELDMAIQEHLAEYAA